jgi:hypothetical protein
MDGNPGTTTVGDGQLREEATLGPAGGASLAMDSQQMADSAKRLLASAQSGGFGFQPEAADAMIEALLDCIADLDGLNRYLDVISQAPKLGLTPAAQWVSPLTRKVATDEQGVVLAVHNLKQLLTDMIAAYEAAKQHYDENDTIAAQRMCQLHSSVCTMPAGQ